MDAGLVTENATSIFLCIFMVLRTYVLNMSWFHDSKFYPLLPMAGVFLRDSIPNILEPYLRWRCEKLTCSKLGLLLGNHCHSGSLGPLGVWLMYCDSNGGTWVVTVVMRQRGRMNNIWCCSQLFKLKSRWMDEHWLSPHLTSKTCGCIIWMIELSIFERHHWHRSRNSTRHLIAFLGCVDSLLVLVLGFGNRKETNTSLMWRLGHFESKILWFGALQM